MKYFNTPKFLYEVFGEKQSIVEVACTLIFALLGTYIIYVVAELDVLTWQTLAAFILIADVLAGCIANFSFGTNEFYSKRANSRLIFISIHIHLLIIAWLLSQPMTEALIIWGYTIISAFAVNALKGKPIQGFVAANLMCYGLLLLMYLPLSTWFLMVSMFFMIKVLFSFSVDHFNK